MAENLPDDLAFAMCPDGDTVILSADGVVSQVSHEIPEVVGSWPTLAQFFFDTVTDVGS